VTAAAHALGVTEPAVSASVGALKRELGDDLFVRGSRGVVLTPGGERLAVVAAEILLLAEEARRDLRALN
jgi:DNA-binding transcriptional LysR family regulator